MGAAVDVCTWKPCGQASKFVVGADVAGACFGHMVAAVWDGSAVRRENKDRLKRCLALSVAERGNGAGAPPQHAWAASLLDACKLQQIRSRRSCSSSESSNSDSDSAGGGVPTGCGDEAEETFRDWGTPYENVDRLLGAPARGVTPGALKATGRSCRWCSHQVAVGDCVYVLHAGVRYHGTVVLIPPGSGSNGVSAVDVVLQRGGERLELRVHSTAITVPGSRPRCTAWCGAAPSASNMDSVCMGHLVAYVSGLGRGHGAPSRVGRELACSRVSSLLEEMDKCCDRGGVPSCERVWVNHVAAAVKYQGMAHAARAAATPREREKAGAAAEWFRQWGTVFAGVRELLQAGRRFVCAGQHKVPWVAVPAACGYCGAWGVEAMSKVSGGKRHFGRECCGQGSVVSAAACPSPSSNSSSSDSESSGGSSSGDGDDRAPVKSKKRAIMPANALDDWMLATDRERRSVLVPAGVDAGVQQYVDIMFGSGTECTQNDCGECVPCIARVARKFARSANNSLCMSSISFEQSDAHLRRHGGSSGGGRGGGAAVGGYQPSVTHCGRVYHRFPALRNSDTSLAERQAQYYVLDPQDASQRRAAALRNRGNGLTSADRTGMKLLFDICDSLFREVNPYVKAYQYAAAQDVDSDVSFFFDAALKPSAEHARKYNPPGVDELCALVSVPDGSVAKAPSRAVMLRGSGEAHNIPNTHMSIDMLHYTLMYPFGGGGWNTELHKSAKPHFTLARYYSYLLQWRKDHPNTAMRFGRLTQELAVDSAMRVEFSRLDFLQHNQDKLRVSSYAELVEAEQRGDASDAGRPASRNVVLPSSFVGGPRDMSNRLQDSLRLMQIYGAPAFFVTMTCSTAAAHELCRAAWENSVHPTPTQFKPGDMPEMGVKVFRAQLDELVKDVRAGCVGPYQAHCFTVEFQKRGLPHVHMIAWTDETRAARDARIDDIVTAEASCESDVVFSLQLEQMLHSCRAASANGGKDGKIGCLDSNGKCCRGFPKEYARATSIGEDGFPLYKRRPRAGAAGFGRELPRGGCAVPLRQYANSTIIARGGLKRDNNYMVPTSAVLLNKYRVHLNVEAVGSSSVVKYLHKYVFKGVERVYAGASDGGRDEVEEYTDFRYMSSCRAYWGHFGYPITGIFPSVVPLQVVPMECEQLFYFEGSEKETLEKVPAVGQLQAFYNSVTEARRLRREGGTDTYGVLGGVYGTGPKRDGARRRLVERGQLVAGDAAPGHCLVRYRHREPVEVQRSSVRCVEAIDNLTYPELPMHYRFDLKDRVWVARARGSATVGRVHFVHPSAGDRFFLRLLLYHVKGPGSEAELFVVDGDTHQTFKAAALARGLLVNDNEYVDFMHNACDVLVAPPAVRAAFCGLLKNCTVADPMALLHSTHHGEPVWKYMCPRSGTKAGVLAEIRDDLVANGVDPCFAGIVGAAPAGGASGAATTEPCCGLVAEHTRFAHDTVDESGGVCDAGVGIGDWAMSTAGKLNEDQRAVYDVVVQAASSGQGGCFFLSAIGGAGKTFVANAIIARLRSSGKFVAATAATGVASNLLLRGGTVHKTFSVPVTDLRAGQSCNFTRGDQTGKFVRDLSLLIIDEVAMLHKHVIEAIDVSFRDCRREAHRPFGGVAVLLCGDFRQNCPVVARGESVRDASVLSSRLWTLFADNVYHLLKNMRMRRSRGLLGAQMSRYHLRVGDGTANVDPTAIGESGTAWDAAFVDRTVAPVPSFLRIADGMAGDDMVDAVCDWVFGAELLQQAASVRGRGYAAGRRVLAPTNRAAWGVTQRVCKRLGDPDHVSLSLDESNGEGRGYVPPGELNTIESASLPPHRLEIRIGHPYMLLRNFRGKHMNGVVYTLRAYSSVGMLLEPEHGCGDSGLLLLPRMDLHSDPMRDGVDFHRRQFPVRLAWACTIHKAQGATLVKYTLYVESDCFSHGQMYTAVTRGSAAESCAIRVPPDCIESDGEAFIRNVVDRCLLLPASAAAGACGGESSNGSCTLGAGSTGGTSDVHGSGGAAGAELDIPFAMRSPHTTFAGVVAARKSDFERPEHDACMCCDGSDGILMQCYCCPNAVHERCMRNARMASSSWAEPVCLREHFSARGSAPDFFVCPPCYNDYHDLARVSKFHDTGYLGRQGEASLWPCGPAAAPEALL